MKIKYYKGKQSWRKNETTGNTVENVEISQRTSQAEICNVLGKCRGCFRMNNELCESGIGGNWGWM